MFQKEVADKIVPITSKPAKSMNSLRVLTQTFFDCSLLCTVPPESFTPPPKVDSAVISLKRKSETVISYEDFLKFEKFIRNVFALKRKQLGTVLKNSYNQELIEKSLEACEIDRKLRAETLSLDQVHRLYFEMTK
jgi:16S rRNA (adenine1518-N6/adenine1519-N6)-dimethyltransferase